MGITTTFVALLYEPYQLSLPEIGTTLAKYDLFGQIEGYKTAADLLIPVTGKVIQRNDNLVLQGNQGQGGYIASINGDPYGGGWMIVVQLNKPEELDELLTPLKYLERLGKIEIPSD